MGLLDRITAKATPYEEDYEYGEEMLDEYAEDGEYYEEEAPIAPVRSLPQAEVARIVTVWVSDYKDVKDFASEFRGGLPVILNLSDAGDAERMRIVDFAVGLCFGLEGSFSRISEDVFLLTPSTVKLDSVGADTTHRFA